MTRFCFPLFSTKKTQAEKDRRAKDIADARAEKDENDRLYAVVRRPVLRLANRVGILELSEADAIQILLTTIAVPDQLYALNELERQLIETRKYIVQREDTLASHIAQNRVILDGIYRQKRLNDDLAAAGVAAHRRGVIEKQRIATRRLEDPVFDAEIRAAEAAEILAATQAANARIPDYESLLD